MEVSKFMIRLPLNKVCLFCLFLLLLSPCHSNLFVIDSSFLFVSIPTALDQLMSMIRANDGELADVYDEAVAKQGSFCFFSLIFAHCNLNLFL